jgi:hypothetical protein
MKILFIISILTSTLYFNSFAQSPKGFRKGQITLEDNSILSGYIKEHFRSYACLAFIPENGGRKTIYDGSQIRSVTIDSLSFVCLRGDFFRVISEGRLGFLQKYSDASNAPSYNGTEAIFVNGTIGEKGDYFIYIQNKNQLVLINRKTYKKIIPEVLAEYPREFENAFATYDISQIRLAINTFNSNHNN